MKCGVVDVGSNTIRLSIYHWERDGSMKLLMNRKVMAGLAGYIQDGVMSDSGILVACRTLQAFAPCWTILKFRTCTSSAPPLCGTSSTRRTP